MSKMSRRSLLLSSAGGALVAALPRWAGAESAATTADGRVLVVVFLRGGVDGLSLVVPHSDPAYHAARRSIAIARPGKPGGAIDLDGQFGLHPRLAPLEAAYKAKELALVHAVGSPHATRSHFEAQDYAETATPGVHSTRTGWLARSLAGKPRTPLGVVALAAKRPLALRGEVDVVTAKRLDQFALRAPRRVATRLETAFDALYASGDDAVVRAGRDALGAAKQLARIERTTNAADYPEGARPLAEVAALVRADVGLRAAWIDVGGWDTHQGQGGADSGRLPRLLDGLGKGLAAFRKDLGARFGEVVVLVMSEFGRTVAENGTGGTDHGHGSAMLLLGGRVRGGKVYGKWPGLGSEARYEGRDLAVTTDYREVLAELAVKHVGARDASRVAPGFAPRGIDILA